MISQGDTSDFTGIPKLSQYLKDRFRVVAFDNYGPNGPDVITQAFSDDTVKKVTDNCLTLLQHLKISRAHFFAHRQVGYVALKLALDYPELVSSVGLLDFEILPHLLLRPKVQEKFSQMMGVRANDPSARDRVEMMRQVMEAGKLGVTPDGKTVPPEVRDRIAKVAGPLRDFVAPDPTQTDPQLAQAKLIIPASPMMTRREKSDSQCSTRS